jgi:hypothetical protein
MYTDPSNGARINTKLPISSSKYFVSNSMTLHCFSKSGIDRMFRAHRNASGVSMAWHANMPRMNVPAERYTNSIKEERRLRLRRMKDRGRKDRNGR